MTQKRWRSLTELRSAFIASGVTLTPKHRRCRGKIRHALEADAQRHLAVIRHEHSHEHSARLARLHCYLCPHCRGWHVGHGS